MRTSTPNFRAFMTSHGFLYMMTGAPSVSRTFYMLLLELTLLQSLLDSIINNSNAAANETS